VEEAPSGDPGGAAPRPQRWRTAVRAAGELFVTGGLVLLLFAFYELVVTDWQAESSQASLTTQLHEHWAHPDPNLPQVELGDAFAVLRIPRLGYSYARAVLEGTQEKQLSQGPGHYIGTAMPGQVGNLALAGHRVGKGSPFLDLDALRPGDAIVVETADTWFTYRVLGDPRTGSFTSDPSGIPGQEVVRPTDIDVVSPTPDAAPTAKATGAYLTLTTCHPRYSARQRLVIHARLEGHGVSKASAPNGPPALHER
jgi:sortase A